MTNAETHRSGPPPGPSCPLCGGPLVDIRAKAVCGSCGRIVEGCCEGAPGGVDCRPGAPEPARRRSGVIASR